MITNERYYRAEQFKAFFKEVAKVHDVNEGKYLKEGKKYLIDKIKEYVLSKPHMISILDLGAGSGRISVPVLSYLITYGKLDCATLIDASSEMLDYCKNNLLKIHTNSEKLALLKTEVNDFIAECESKYDIIILSLVCSITGFPPELFEKIYRILKPGGILIFSDIHPQKIHTSPYFTLDNDGNRHKLKLKGYSEKDLYEQASIAGFSCKINQVIYEGKNKPYLIIIILEKDIGRN